MRIILCDPNRNEIEKYAHVIDKNRKLLPEKDAKIDIIESGERLLFELSDEPNEADVIIINTEFPGKMTGIDALKQLREIGYTGEVIFLSRDKDPVFDSFAVRPADYLLKTNVTPKKFFFTVADACAVARKRKREMLTFTCAGEIKNIAVEDILYFEIVQRIVEVHYLGEVFEFYSTMKKLENLMHGRGFVRSHRAFLVNSAHISYIMGHEIILDNEETVPVSPSYAKAVMAVKEKPEKEKKEAAGEAAGKAAAPADTNAAGQSADANSANAQNDSNVAGQGTGGESAKELKERKKREKKALKEKKRAEKAAKGKRGASRDTAEMKSVNDVLEIKQESGKETDADNTVVQTMEIKQADISEAAKAAEKTTDGTAYGTVAEKVPETKKGTSILTDRVAGRTGQVDSK
jgi:DNA-binding LytR/AlgR family response regulator